jgi:hypothetical protein
MPEDEVDAATTDRSEQQPTDAVYARASVSAREPTSRNSHEPERIDDAADGTEPANGSRDPEPTNAEQPQIMSDALRSWRRSFLGWTLRIGLVVVLLAIVAYWVIAALPVARSASLGLCTDEVNTSATYAPAAPTGTGAAAPAAATPQSPEPAAASYVAVPVTEDEHHTCGAGTIPTWTVVAFIALVAILILPELILHFATFRASGTIGSTSVTVEGALANTSAAEANRKAKEYNPLGL